MSRLDAHFPKGPRFTQNLNAPPSFNQGPAYASLDNPESRSKAADYIFGKAFSDDPVPYLLEKHQRGENILLNQDDFLALMNVTNLGDQERFEEHLNGEANVIYDDLEDKYLCELAEKFREIQNTEKPSIDNFINQLFLIASKHLQIKATNFISMFNNKARHPELSSGKAKAPPPAETEVDQQLLRILHKRLGKN